MRIFLVLATILTISLSGFANVSAASLSSSIDMFATSCNAQVGGFSSSRCSACKSISLLSNGGDTCNSPQSSNPVYSLIENTVNILSIIVGVVSVIVIILSGLKFIISNGDSSRVNSARSSLIWAIVGLFIAALAHLIVTMVLQKASAL